MAEPAVARRRGRHAPPPGAWQALATALRRVIARAFEAAADRWLWLAGLAAALAFAVLSQWSGELARGSAPGERCVRAAFGVAPPAGDPACAAQLRRLVAAAPPGDALTCAPGGRNTARLCAFDEPGHPRLFVWADNLFVALYTLCFVAGIAAAYARLRPPGRPVPRLRHLVFVLSIASCLAAAALDLGENFWLLARIGQPLDEAAAGLGVVAAASLWKFRLAGLNLLLTFGWIVWATWRRRIPYALLLPWPQRCWDAPSRAWFDPARVRYDVANAARAYPLYPRDLMALAGAPGDAELHCERDGNRLHIRVRSARLADPHRVDVELDLPRRGVRVVTLGCPNLVPKLHDQGLGERIVLAGCRAAWRLGAEALESPVPASDDEAVRAQNRRWVRMALRLGWDAELSDAVRQALPPGLAHLGSLQALMAYPDGRRWWSTANMPLLLRFVCRPERAQAGPRQPGREPLASDHRCLARLHAYAREQGIRLGL
jgi:hypothetical protein